MAIELYHYVHCPFCVRVRMALGYLGLTWTSNVVRYDDEQTPVKLCGKKMLPILVRDGKAYNESLDIIALLDTQDQLSHSSWGSTTQLISPVGEWVHSLAMPYWVWMPEFDESSRDYFIKKKSLKRGPFPELAKRRAEFEQPLLEWLTSHQSALTPYWQSPKITIRDIGIASHLWGLFTVPEFRFPEAWHEYLMRIKQDCRFDYHRDFWDMA